MVCHLRCTPQRHPKRLCNRNVVLETSRVAATSDQDVIEYHVTEREVRLVPVNLSVLLAYPLPIGQHGSARFPQRHSHVATLLVANGTSQYSSQCDHTTTLL